MRSGSVLTSILITGAALGMTACRPTATAPAAGGRATGSHAAGVPVTTWAGPDGTRPAPAGSTLTLGNRDNGSAFCL
jgi:hypothetical protein